MTDTIKRRPDGSIDTGLYIARGRRMRAEKAREMASHAGGSATHRARRPAFARPAFAWPAFAWIVLCVLMLGMTLPLAA